MAQSLVDQVYEKIKSEIITCTLAPGQQIAQPQLAEKFNTGVTPIREALQRLTQERLVQPIPRFGYIVTPITLADMSEIFELRSILESAAARLAALHASQEQLDQLAESASFTYVYKDPESYTHFLEHNTSFHQAVAIASGNHRLAEQISQLLDELTRVFHLGLDLKDSAEEMRMEHQELTAALRQRDPAQAEQIVQAQITRSRQRVIEALLSVGSKRGAAALGQAVQVSPS